jgi:hypothetical protein
MVSNATVAVSNSVTNRLTIRSSSIARSMSTGTSSAGDGDVLWADVATVAGL